MDPSRVEEEQDSPPGNGEATEEKPTLVAQRLNEKDEKPNALESDGKSSSINTAWLQGRC